jgi:hypothetical protein
MRCSCCNKRLTDYESTLKHAETGHYLDTCMDCLSEIAYDAPMVVKDRKDLLTEVGTQEELDELTDVEYNKYSKDNDEDKDS